MLEIILLKKTIFSKEYLALIIAKNMSAST
jgi:hypothetical protein